MSRMETVDLSVVNDLISAKALIEQGWCQHKIREWRGGVVVHCAIGALYYTVGQKEEPYYKLLRILGRALGFIMRDHNGANALCITDWNDKSMRKKEEVVAAFSKAIDLATEECTRSVSCQKVR
jgi:hypothetical protein